MGLLDKTNPAATRESVIRWAIGGGIAAPVLVRLILFQRPPIPQTFLPVVLMTAALAGAGFGALMEWQFDDGEEKPLKKLPPGSVWDRDLDP